MSSGYRVIRCRVMRRFEVHPFHRLLQFIRFKRAGLTFCPCGGPPKDDFRNRDPALRFGAPIYHLGEEGISCIARQLWFILVVYASADECYGHHQIYRSEFPACDIHRCPSGATSALTFVSEAHSCQLLRKLDEGTFRVSRYSAIKRARLA